MKKLTAALILGFVCASSISNAGNMGPVATQSLPVLIPYIGGEGSYTWNSIDGFRLNVLKTHRTNQGWGGRFSGGMFHPISDRLWVNVEFGGGYYGQTKLAFKGYNATNILNGFDVLIGAIYKFTRIDLFANVGFMAINDRVNEVQNLEVTQPGGLYKGTVSQNSDAPQIIPEVKVGGIYNVNKNWGVTLAYLHAFGEQVGRVSFINAEPDLVTVNQLARYRSPSLDSIMFGLRYSIF